MFAELDQGEDSEREVKPFDGKDRGAFDQGVRFAESRSQADRSHDLIEGTHFACGSGCSKPEGRGDQKQDELKSFNDALFGRKGRAVRKPGR